MTDKRQTDHPDLEFLRLFIAGNEANSQLARKNLDHIVERSKFDKSLVKIIDVYDDHQTAIDNKIFLTPTLLIGVGGSLIRVVGNLDDVDGVLHKMKAC
ncbi:circadian clock KaiB family protein [Desulfoferula mesophila]|uniref:KaiB domain-containing protein n=1 Tax=Desulfoferula mesophila TaxID=3058419 RepID=A0AAU9E9V0_9BACT|nr:hypothetical protein FAK_09590 [Desulfoferula mesophilus]